MKHKLYELLEQLDAARWHYTLHRTQRDQVTILVTLVGQRIEIYVSSNGTIGYSVFVGDEAIKSDDTALMRLLESEGRENRPLSP